MRVCLDSNQGIWGIENREVVRREECVVGLKSDKIQKVFETSWIWVGSPDGEILAPLVNVKTSTSCEQ